MKTYMLRKIVLSVVGLVVMLLFAACSGVGTASTTTPTSLSGTITAVSAANHSVTISSGGQSYTITGLSDQAVLALQAQIGKTYTIQVTQKSDGSYNITAGTQPTPGVSSTGSNGTPSANVVLGNISFVGPVQSTSSSSLTVKLPDGSALTMAINTSTDQSGLNGTQLSNGQLVKIEANTAPDGSFTASKVKIADSGDDATTVDFQGTTTQAVGSDNVLHFQVGTQSYSYTINSAAKLDDFNGNAQSIASSTSVKVEVQFTGTTGSIMKISNPSN